jgi:UDP-GlcNAc:undecaprenyl-phosphate GlcNAc-1-phosphate transferase
MASQAASARKFAGYARTSPCPAADTIAIALVLGIAFAVAAVLSYVLTIPERRLAIRFGFVDLPDERRKHEGPRPRLGGAGMLLAFVAALITVRQQFDAKLLAIVAAATVLVVAGSFDDKRQPKQRELGAAPQLALQLVAAGIAVLAGVSILDVRDPTAAGPFGGVIALPLWAGALLSLFWIAGMINTVNFLDGLDGLAGGVVGIAAVILALVSLKLGQTGLAVLCVALAGAAAGFLPHNLHPARTFMGTSGAWFLGFVLACLAILGGAKILTALLVIGVPILDVALLILLRVIDRQPVWRGDRRHLHHRLLDTGLGHRGTVLLYYCLSAAFGLYAVAFTNNQSVGLGLKIYGLAMLVAVMIVILAVLSRRRPA